MKPDCYQCVHRTKAINSPNSCVGVAVSAVRGFPENIVGADVNLDIILFSSFPL